MPMLAGCAFSTARVDLGYVPDSTKKSPLSTIKPMTIALQIEDQRVMTEQTLVGQKKNNFGKITAPVVSNRDVTSVVYEALKNELENNNHKVAPISTGSGTDLAIAVKLKRYWSSYIMHFADLEMTGTIIAEVTVVNPETNLMLGQKTVSGTFTESRQIALDGAFESVLNGALVEFTRTFSRDPTLLDAIRSAPKAS